MPDPRLRERGREADRQRVGDGGHVESTWSCGIRDSLIRCVFDLFNLIDLIRFSILLFIWFDSDRDNAADLD